MLVFMNIKKASQKNKKLCEKWRFSFAMCSATDSYDIALAMGNLDGVESVL